MMHPLKTQAPQHGKARRFVVLFAYGLGLMPLLAGAQSKMEVAEMAKRQAMVEEARILVTKGDQAMGQQRPDVALEAYAGARELVPAIPALQETRVLITERYVVAALSQSAVLANRGDLEGAKAMVERVLEKNVAPDNASALRMRKMLNEPVRTNPALSPEHHEDVEKVKALILKANGAVALARFDFAEKCYEDILRIDAQNVLARRGLMEVLRLRGESKIVAYDRSRAELLLEVDEAWLPQVPKADDDIALTGFLATDEGAPETTVQAKLRQIIIPMVALDDVTLADAVEFLRVASSREDLLTVDQKDRGINFNINIGPEDSAVGQKIQNKRFDLRLRNVPVDQVLKYITRMTGTVYKVDPYAVTIIPAGQVTEEIYLRQYQVPADFITALSEDAGGAGALDPFAAADPGQGLLPERLPVQELLKRKGVSFREGASASYSAPSNMLILVNTANNHAMVEQIIDIIKGADPVLCSVQVTMIKVEQKVLEELGFDWLLNPYQINNGDPVFLGGGSVGNTGGRSLGDFSTSTLMLPGGANATAPNVITNGLRSGDRAFVSNSIDAIVNNPDRASQGSRVAPGILSLTGILSDGGGQVIMRGLSQKTGVDTMAKPSVITRSGESALITMAREFIYPTEYDPPELQQGGGGNQFGGNNAGPAFPVVPANPTSFETRNVGITMEVLPLAGPNNRYISLTLAPEIVEFDGFVNYGSPITATVPDSLGNPARVTLTRNEILMPVFSAKRTNTQLTVQDGATVAYGGLLSQNIQSVKDKVPVIGDIPWLGRMFQSKSYQPISTAIIFLVKVDLLDPTGRPYRELGSR